MTERKEREEIMKKAGVCARRVASQREMIEKTLAKEPMTIVDLAKRLGLSNDTIRNRIGELVADGRRVRVVGWNVLETTMVRVWGPGPGRDEPRPVRVRVDGVKRNRKAAGGARLPVSVPVVRFRREGMDEWLFRIRELR